MATVRYSHTGRKIWNGQDVERSTITVMDIGDEFHAWDSGNNYEAFQPGGPWKLVSRGIPIPSPKPTVAAGDSF